MSAVLFYTHQSDILCRRVGNRLLQRRQVATVTVRRSWKNGLKSKVNQNYGPKVALKKQASEASAKAMSESREKAAIASSIAAAQSAEVASSTAASEQAASASSASAAQQASETVASKASESQQAAEQAKQSAIKPITQAEAIEAEKKAFEGAEVIVSHNGTFSSQPDGSMTAHDYSGAQGEDFWTFTPNADGTITVLSKFGSVKGGEQQIETHVVPR